METLKGSRVGTIKNTIKKFDSLLVPSNSIQNEDRVKDKLEQSFIDFDEINNC